VFALLSGFFRYGRLIRLFSISSRCLLYFQYFFSAYDFF